jgi:hypothetical protein
MNAKEFVIFFRRLLNKDMTAFIANMEILGVTDKAPHEWVVLLVKWMELSTEHDARRAYREHYQ